MEKVLIPPARFMAATFGVAFIGAFLSQLVPVIVSPVALVVILTSIVAMIRPLPLSWLRYRAVSAGLLLGALALLGSLAEDNDGQRADVVSNTTSTSAASTKSNAASGNAGSRRTATESKADPLQDKTKRAVWIEITKDAVRQRLKDSGSARFQKVVFHAYQGKTPVVCGEVNGKNSFGAYSGFQGFIASGESLVYIESEFQDGEFATAWNEMCRR